MAERLPLSCHPITDFFPFHFFPMTTHSPSPAPQETDHDKLCRHLESAMEDIEAYLNESDDVKREKLEESIQPLCIMKRIEIEVQLAWGGPSYGFKILYDPTSRDFLSGVFYYTHWFRYEETCLSPVQVEKVVQAYALNCMP